MKRILLTLTFLLCFLAADGQKKVVFMPQWIPQSQFAGYYLALEKGFYAEEGLDVEIRHITGLGTDVPEDHLVQDEVQIAGMQFLQALLYQAGGAELVNVLQVTQNTGLACVSQQEIASLHDLDGKRVGRWLKGYSEICRIIEREESIFFEWVPFKRGINLFIYGAVDATLCYTYSELLLLEQSRGRIPESHIYRFADSMIDFPEDGLYVTRSYYDKNKETVDAFVRASVKGWNYAREHRDEAVASCRKYLKAAGIKTNDSFQKLMLDAYLELQVNHNTGKADFAPISRETFESWAKRFYESGSSTRLVKYEEMER